VGRQAWLYLLAAIVLEVAGTTALKLSEGLSRLLPTVLVCCCYALAFAGLALALKEMAVGVAYAIWSGMGTALIALIGFAYFGEPMTALKWLSIGMIILGVAGLNLGDSLKY
jgi:small multidrug resistance pump